MAIRQVSRNRGRTTNATDFTTILPRIEVHAQIYFRHLRCPDKKADAIQETIALAFKWYLRLTERGKDPATFVSVLADFAVRAVKCGRRLCGQEKARDVLSSQAQQRQGFKVESLPISTRTKHEDLYGTVHGQRLLDSYEERLRDNRQTPVPEQVCFRLDFPAWLVTRTSRDRQIIEKMSINDRTQDLARKFGLTPGRISQLRRDYCEDWSRFCGDLQDDPSPASPDEDRP